MKSCYENIDGTRDYELHYKIHEHLYAKKPMLLLDIKA